LIEKKSFFYFQHACQNYQFIVAIADERGYGPASVPISKTTKYSPGAPPKNLKAELKGDDPLTVNITWQPSCPETDRLSYFITVTDVVTKVVILSFILFFQLKNSCLVTKTVTGFYQ